MSDPVVVNRVDHKLFVTSAPRAARVAALLREIGLSVTNDFKLMSLALDQAWSLSEIKAEDRLPPQSRMIVGRHRHVC